MKTIKKALDPKNILNPGKMGFDDPVKDSFAPFTYKEFVETPDQIKSFRPAADNEIFACINCGLCPAGCTVFARTGLESENARGRVIQAYYMMKGLLEPSKEVADKFYLLHRDAEDMEHALDDEVLEQIDAALGRPAMDPHGRPIPRGVPS